VLTRQRTTAMTKGQEIGALRYQRDMQLEQINEQIALQQYKVSTEQQIFNLSTTRIGLEYELLAAQEEAAGVQNQQTAALLQVVQTLQSGLASGALMGRISALGPTGTGTGLLATLLGGLGLGGYVPPGILTGVGGATNYLAQIPQPYQSIANYINNLDPNFLVNLWNAMQTPPGSSDRESALQEAAPYAQDANTSGYDFNSFAQWIQSGGVITGTTATVTNQPAPTGPQNIPGMFFGQYTTPGYAPSTIPGATPTGQTPFDAVTQSMTNLNTIVDKLSQAMTTLVNMLTGLPHFQSGGPVTETGPALVHKGEYILPKPIAGLVSGIQNFMGGSNLTGNPHVQVESTLLDMTTQRTNMEMTVISARQDQITAEMQYLIALNDTLTKIANMPASGISGSLESMLTQVYQTRGRYGSGNFRREYL